MTGATETASSSKQACKLFLGGLSAETTTEVLRNHFSKYGRIVDVVAMEKGGRPRCFGFVTFDSQESAARACSESQLVDKRYIDVKWAVPGEQAEVQRPNKLFVGGFPPETTAKDLQAHFAEFGPVEHAEVVFDRRSKRSRLFGFVTFASGVQGAQAFKAALQHQGHMFGEKVADVKEATPAHDFSPCSAASAPATPSFHMQQQQHLPEDWEERKQRHFEAQQRQLMYRQEQVRQQRQLLMQQHQMAWEGSMNYGGFGVAGMGADYWGMFRGERGVRRGALGGLPLGMEEYGTMMAGCDALAPAYAPSPSGFDSTGSFVDASLSPAGEECCESPIDCCSSASSTTVGGDEKRPSAGTRSETPPRAGVAEKDEALLFPPGLEATSTPLKAASAGSFGIDATPMKVVLSMKPSTSKGFAAQERKGGA